MADPLVVKPLTNRRKDVVRKGVYAHAFKECRAELEAFTGCMEGRMLSVVWACRAENHAMNECLHKLCATMLLVPCARVLAVAASVSVTDIPSVACAFAQHQP